MVYPLNLLSQSTKIYPIFGDQVEGEPYIFNFTSQNSKTLEIDTANFEAFQKVIFDEIHESGHTWAIGRYLEERSNLLRNYPQMIEEGRVYHLGLDLAVPKGFSIYAPIDGTVHTITKEEELGSYGGLIVLEHNVVGTKFYSLYGHLDSNHIVEEGQEIKGGQEFAKIGSHSDSGGWFTHTHLQIITERAAEEGRMFQGYITAKDLTQIENLFPNPAFLFRY